MDFTFLIICASHNNSLAVKYLWQILCRYVKEKKTQSNCYAKARKEQYDLVFIIKKIKKKKLLEKEILLPDPSELVTAVAHYQMISPNCLATQIFSIQSQSIIIH